MTRRDGDALDLLRTRWMGVELRHLASLSAIARGMSFRGAAEELGYVPSAVSQQISRLESVVGERLVERASGGTVVNLTRAGDMLARHAERILYRLYAAEADLSSLKAERGRELRVGVHQGVPQSLICATVRVFTNAWPGVRIIPTGTGTAAPLLELVRCGDIDVTFAQLPLPPGPFGHSVLYDDEFALVSPPDGDLEAPVSLADLARLPLVWLTTSPPSVEPDQLQALADAAVARIDTARAALALVRAGVGPAILPRSMIGGGMDAMPLPMVPARTLVLVWNAQRRLLTGAKRFLAIAEELAGETATEQRAACAVAP